MPSSSYLRWWLSPRTGGLHLAPLASSSRQWPQPHAPPAVASTTTHWRLFRLAPVPPWPCITCTPPTSLCVACRGLACRWPPFALPMSASHRRRRHPPRTSPHMPPLPRSMLGATSPFYRHSMEPPAEAPDPVVRGSDPTPPTLDLAAGDHHTCKSSLWSWQHPRPPRPRVELGSPATTIFASPRLCPRPLEQRRGGGDEGKRLAAAARPLGL